MTRLHDLTGLVVGEWTVTRQHRTRGIFTEWLCQCSCGRFFWLKRENLIGRRGKRSHMCHVCNGSIVQDQTSVRYLDEYAAWKNMLTRCRSKGKPTGKYYADRGIAICDRWLEFDNFYEDVGSMPAPGYTLERKDNDKGYCLENCEWATHKKQSQNRRCAIYVVHEGQKILLKVLAKKLGLNYGTIYHRRKRGADLITGKRLDMEAI